MQLRRCYGSEESGEGGLGTAVLSIVEPAEEHLDRPKIRTAPNARLEQTALCQERVDGRNRCEKRLESPGGRQHCCWDLRL